MKRALITSATSSIGKVLAQAVAKAGFEVTLHYNSNQSLATQLKKDVNAELVQADLSQHQGIVSLIKALKAAPKFDVVINNAGIDDQIDDTDPSEWDRVLRINTIAPAVIHGHARELINDGGVIVNISSAYGHEMFGDKSLAAYSASKAALNSLTRTFAKRLAPNIRVNAIAPGYVDSRWNADYSSSELKRIKSEQLIERLIDPQEVADLTLHIISNKALDGEVIYLDGGLTLKTI